MDPLMLLFLLIAGRTGADRVSSVDTVIVQRGRSVTIPCYYDNMYQQHVKHWCRGTYLSRTPIVRTDYQKKSGKVSIRDDPDQRVFTVTMNNLTDGDSGSYWCGVEISRHSVAGTLVYLSVTEASGISSGPPATQKDKRFGEWMDGWDHFSETIRAFAAVSTTKMVLQTVSVHDEEGENNEKQRWEQVLCAVLKAGTGVFYLICTIIAVQLHWNSCRKRGTNQKEAEC
ncbi:CMRF35-like molecule 8 [Brienomyrus brachyistius]|uniref:CMRF35-like molecule 8 n=1 Tax=Brienomyrus brachyistius TaxID=42636 RepID=UPI0020B35775|nr:CMRF35-like molecule 8 [Brienomyrus brachyistius]